MKSRVFIGSSQESISIAYAIQESLEQLAEVTVWDQGIFEPSTYALDNLSRALGKFDFGVFVFSGEDIVKIRDVEYLAVRDNVLFELGLFIGHFGKEKTFIVMPLEVKDFRLPTDLMGLGLIKFISERQDGNLRAALGPACNKIIQMIRRFEEEVVVNPPASSLQPRIPEDAEGVSIDLPEFIVLSHNIGLPQAFLFVGLTNALEKPVYISKINLLLRHESGNQISLRARSYFPRQSHTQAGESPPEYPLMRITLKGGESWIENSRFYDLRSDEDQADVDDLASKMQAAVIEGRKLQEDKNQSTGVGETLCLRAVSLFEKNFNLAAGKYQGVMVALSPDSGRRAIKGFRFDFSEASLRTMVKNSIEGFVYGAGIYYGNNNCSAWCRISPMDDASAMDAYKACDPELLL